MSEQRRNEDLRRENDELDKRAKESKRVSDLLDEKNQEMQRELHLYSAMQRCRTLRDRVTNAYPWARDFDAFLDRDMVCGHHPLEQPH